MLVSVSLNASLVPLIPVVMIKDLGRLPWELGVYTFILMATTMLLNTLAARRVRSGFPITVLLIISAVCQFIAACTLSLSLPFWVLVPLLSLSLAGAGSSVPLYYTLGRHLAEQNHVNAVSFNALLRTVTSLGWIIGPFIAFTAYAVVGYNVLAYGVFIASLFYIALTVYLHKKMNRKVRIVNADNTAEAIQHQSIDKRTALSATLFIFVFSFCHILTTTSLPIFFVTEVGLADSLPGITVAIKSIAEVFCILISPLLIRRIGMHTGLTLSAGIAVIAFVTLANVHTPIQAMLGAWLEGTYYGIFAGISLTYVQSLFSGDHNSANASYMNGIYAGVLLAGPLSAVIAQIDSFQTNITLSTLIMSVWLVYLIIQFKRERT